MGDGYLTIDKTGKHGNKIQIATNSFDRMSIEKIIIPQLNEINIDCGLDKYKDDQYILRIHWGCHKEFFNFIGPCPVECFKYKWPPQFQ